MTNIMTNHLKYGLVNIFTK